MSAHTSATTGGNWRRLDVDQYDEDRVLPSELYDPDPRGPDGVLHETQAKQPTVRALLARGDVGGALGVVLDGAPYGEGVDEAKVSAERGEVGGEEDRGRGVGADSVGRVDEFRLFLWD